MKIRLSELRSVIREETQRLVEMPGRPRDGVGSKEWRRKMDSRRRRDVKGKIYLPTPTALALWSSEIRGQLSDGMWENSTPWEHWVFWSKMTPELGAPKVEADQRPVKDSYNFAALIPIVGDRMVKSGRMAAAGGTPEDARHAEYMPETYEEFMRNKETGSWEQDYIKKYMEPITPELAKKYYATKYDMKDLKRDLMSIKAAMKNFEFKSAAQAPASTAIATSPDEALAPQE